MACTLYIQIPDTKTASGGLVWCVVLCLMCFAVETGPTLSLPSLTDISSMATTTDMSLIAATMSRVLYTVARKFKDVYQLGQQQVVVMIEQRKDKKDNNAAVEVSTAPGIVVAINNTEGTQEDK